MTSRRDKRSEIPWVTWRGNVSLLLTLLACTPSVQATELRGSVAVEYRQFFQTGSEGQDTTQPSLVVEPQWYWDWEGVLPWADQGGESSFAFTPFVRWDGMDDERTHADIREALYLYYNGNWEFRVGIGKVFWGVTESQHLVDVINQTDAVESVDGEDKLGQPLIQLSYFSEWGAFEGFVLPYFRDRTFAGNDGRLTVPGVDQDHARYASSREEKHVDTALRYSQSGSIWDLGLSYFHGTNRDPYFLDSPSGGDNPIYSLVPFYAQMDQVGMDLQVLWGEWLWKAEALRRWSEDDHTAFTGGFEYTFIGVDIGMGDTAWDVGVLGEYLYDSRGSEAPVVGQNDLFVGMRWVFNDMAGAEVLMGVSQDLEDRGSRTGRIEASSRFNDAWKWHINAWFFEADEVTDPTYVFRRDDMVTARLTYYF
ncbi:hypothetical protein [Photobacterium japonica]|uniref:hypothetical protein n=1 Tax=Photobacterium japonica TaxID=2910235 RepID=UPI003D122F13